MASDREHPFFRPRWRRIAIVVVCAVWAAVEWASGQPFWGMVALAVTGYAVWTFLIAYDDKAGADAG